MWVLSSTVLNIVGGKTIGIYDLINSICTYEPIYSSLYFFNEHVYGTGLHESIMICTRTECANCF